MNKVRFGICWIAFLIALIILILTIDLGFAQTDECENLSPYACAMSKLGDCKAEKRALENGLEVQKQISEAYRFELIKCLNQTKEE